MEKYFIASKQTTKMFNFVTGFYDIDITGFQAHMDAYDTKDKALLELNHIRAEEMELMGKVESEMIVLRINEDIDTNGNKMGTYSLPQLSITKQLIYVSHRF